MSCQIEDICDQLSSNKITERKKGSELFMRIIQNEQTIEYLNTDGKILWNMVLGAVHKYLMKESDRAYEEKKKKGILVNGEIFCETVKLMVKEGQKYNTQDILKCISYCLEEDRLYNSCSSHYLTALRDIMLPNENIRCHIEAGDWDVMFKRLKTRFRSDFELGEKNSKDCLETIAQYLKYGPLHGLSSDTLRREFQFISQICKEISANSSRPLQAAVVDMVYYFCLYTAKDNRMSCCKLGEQTIPSIIALYEIQNPKSKEMKILLIKYFLLQVVLHNPKGICEGNPIAYAFSWDDWNRCLKYIYKKCQEDISHTMKSYTQYDKPLLFLFENQVKYLQKDFSRLFAEVIKQMEMKHMENYSCSLVESSKRIKVTSPVMDLIDSIEKTQHWPWINIMGTLLQRYPDILNETYFTNLLQILSKLQVDCKDDTVAHHIYYCLNLLQDIQPRLKLHHNIEVNQIWNIICDTSLRAFGLNQNDPQLHGLLQKLIRNIGGLNQDTIFVHTHLNNFRALHNKNQSEILIKWILSKNSSGNYTYMLSNITARILIGLILKKWPFDLANDFHEEIDEKNDLFGDIADIYLKTELEETVSFVIEKQKNELTVSKCKTVLIDYLCTFLFNSIKNSMNSIRESKNEREQMLHSISIIGLIKNVISYLINFELLQEEDLDQNVFFKMMIPLFEQVNNYLTSSFKINDDLTIANVTDTLHCFHKILSTVSNPFVDKKFREIIPNDLLKTLLSFLQISQREKRIDFKEFRIPLKNLRVMVIKTLVTFSCGLKSFSIQNQEYIFSALRLHDCLLDKYANCDLVMAFLGSIREWKPEGLNANSIEKILNHLLEICTATFKYYTYATEILQFLPDLYSYAIQYGSDESKTLLMQISYAFYTQRNIYGPGFFVALVNCIGRLYQVDPGCTFTKWDENDVILKLPEFLCNKHQEVRFAAIQNIVRFFETSSRNTSRNYHLQKKIFQDICEKCDKVFEVEGSLTEERKVDETVTRSAAVLHILSSIMIVSNFWREESLFALLKIVHIRRLETFPKALKIVSKNLSLKSEIFLLEKYLYLLLCRWADEKFSLDDFPISLFGYNDKTSFHAQYLDDIIPFLIHFDATGLDDISNFRKKSIRTILEDTFSVLCVASMISTVSNLNQDTFEKHKLMRFVIQHVGYEQFKSLFMEKIDQILTNLLSRVSDEAHFQEKFNTSMIFIKSYTETISVSDFKNSLDFLAEIVCPTKDLIQFLFTKSVDKIQKVMMKLTMNVHNSIAIEDKLRCFHHYSVINDLVSEHLSLSDACEYFIRDVCYVLLRFIRDTTFHELCEAALVYFRSSLDYLLEYPQIFCKHFGPIVTILIEHVIEERNGIISDLSLSLLNFLIKDNVQHFSEILKLIDNLPDNSKLNHLSKIQSDLKYGTTEMHLREQIDNFVNSENISKDCSSRVDSLRDLKVHLFCEKRQLKNLYQQLSNLKGFSEDCETSLPHQLISILVDLTHSKNKDVSMEALKCLGELGPADLMTLVVRPEKRLTFNNSTPFEFLTGQIISMLSMYLIDSNIQLFNPSAEVLYCALNTKEGKKITESAEDFGFGSICSEYLYPFMISKKPKSSNLKVDRKQLVVKINSDTVWVPSSQMEYSEWLKRLVCNVLETMSDSYLPLLIPICDLKVEFCESLFPSLIYLLVSLNIDEINTLVTEKINKFFDEHWRLTSDTNNNEELIVKNKKAVQVMLSVVHVVRVNRNNIKRKSSNAEMLDLDYLKIAKAAQYCNAYFTSLLYVELWCHSKVASQEHESNCFKSTILDFIHEIETQDVQLAIVNILRSSYKAIGDLDSLQGCGFTLLLNPQLRVEHYKDSGMWDQALLFYNIQISRGVSMSKEMLINSYKHCGLYESASFCTDAKVAPDYECMWRLSNWSLLDNDTPSQNNKPSFEKQMEKYKYFTLKNIHERDIGAVMEQIENARLCVVEKLKHTSLESSSNLYNILTYLQGFNEIEDFLNAESIDDLKLVFNKWHHQDDIDKNKFSYIEPILTQRMVILNDYLQSSRSEEGIFIKNNLVDFSLKLSGIARQENETSIGLRALMFIQNISQLTDNERSRIYLEDAQLCGISNNKHTGRKILKQLTGDESVNPRLRSLALKLYGKWSADSYSDNPTTIINNYFYASLSLLKGLEPNTDDHKSIFDTYNTLGKFADREYQQLSSHMKSDIFQIKMKNVEKAAEIVGQLTRKSGLTADQRKAKALHEKQYSIDEAEIENTKREQKSFLLIALKYYLKNVSHSDDNNLQIFRIIALFLENRSSESVLKLIEEHFRKIPSYKFITILPQFLPHISDINSEDLFSKQTDYIIERCARDHPHHTLPILLALANSHKDTEYNNSKTKLSVNEDRVVAAKKIVKNLKNNSFLKDIVTRLEMVADALVELAYFTPKADQADKRRDKKFSIPKRLKITVVKNYSAVSVLTENLRISKTANYDNIIGIHSYDNCYELVGGINAPKKIKCIGTDGIAREQLVKGKDDLRQDAVMQQVFTIMNNLLSMSKQTSGLKIRTYKIVPLSMRSGVLEWAKNTMPVGAYLLGDENNIGAHEKYRPQDKSPAYCRKLIGEAAQTSAENKLKVFSTVCKNFKPIFHKFFEENFLHPTVWYERRRAYIRSVATTSMCGYILGIGDRHVSNILLDKTTAEVIHIDFGIAFEQGRTLPTPETVPFRLTRDFVDAMGISGVEGAFRRSCEKTMTVMRDNYQTIMAILGVLLYDPLYSWTVSAAEASRRQRGSLDESVNFRTSPQVCDSDKSSVNTTAERALLRLKAKLQGIEEGTPMSVEHQVGVLIHQAMDPSNLCKLFFGWQAYL
ncbi:hypothetical protein WA026_005780 [Henosepilachna vigintioctopunctata]|uniref:non-specific serine/threonine protein kinase n=1 Tax=Henosepilachna vigintioctopunctata TaxID=420089 RepID=A0AAW1U241_9CUCU